MDAICCVVFLFIFTLQLGQINAVAQQQIVPLEDHIMQGEVMPPTQCQWIVEIKCESGCHKNVWITPSEVTLGHGEMGGIFELAMATAIHKNGQQAQIKKLKVTITSADTIYKQIRSHTWPIDTSKGPINFSALHRFHFGHFARDNAHPADRRRLFLSFQFTAPIPIEKLKRFNHDLMLIVWNGRADEIEPFGFKKLEPDERRGEKAFEVPLDGHRVEGHVHKHKNPSVWIQLLEYPMETCQICGKGPPKVMNNLHKPKNCNHVYHRECLNNWVNKEQDKNNIPRECPRCMEEEAAAKHKGGEGGGGGEGGEGHVRVKRMMKGIINHHVTKRILSHILVKKGGRKLIQGTQRSSSQPTASDAHQQAIPNAGGTTDGIEQESEGTDQHPDSKLVTKSSLFGSHRKVSFNKHTHEEEEARLEVKRLFKIYLQFPILQNGNQPIYTYKLDPMNPKTIVNEHEEVAIEDLHHVDGVNLDEMTLEEEAEYYRNLEEGKAVPMPKGRKGHGPTPTGIDKNKTAESGLPKGGKHGEAMDHKDYEEFIGKDASDDESPDLLYKDLQTLIYTQIQEDNDEKKNRKGKGKVDDNGKETPLAANEPKEPKKEGHLRDDMTDEKVAELMATGEFNLDQQGDAVSDEKLNEMIANGKFNHPKVALGPIKFKEPVKGAQTAQKPKLVKKKTNTRTIPSTYEAGSSSAFAGTGTSNIQNKMPVPIPSPPKGHSIDPMNIEGEGTGENVKENKTKVTSESAKKLNEDKITKIDGEKVEDHSVKVAEKDKQQGENVGMNTKEQEKEKNKKGAQIVIENEVKAIGDHKSGESDYISAEEDIDDADVEKIRKAEKIPDLEEEPSDDGNGKLANSHSEHNYGDGDDNAHLQHGSLMGAGDFLQMFMDQQEEEDKLKDKLKDNQHPANDKHVGEDDYYDHNGDRGFGFMHAVKWAMNAQESKTG